MTKDRGRAGGGIRRWVEARFRRDRETKPTAKKYTKLTVQKDRHGAAYKMRHNNSKPYDFDKTKARREMRRESRRKNR